MSNFASQLTYALAGLGMVALAALSIPSHESAQAAGAAPVNVTNTPLPVQGTVSAAQSGAWNVGINGTPSVNVATLPALEISGSVDVSGGPVIVRNEPLGVLNVRDANWKNVLNTFSRRLCVASSPVFSCGGGTPSVAVPAGLFWVIDQVSGNCSSLVGTQVLAVEMVVNDARGNSSFTIPLTYPAANAPDSGFVFERTQIVVRPFTPPATATVTVAAGHFATASQDAMCLVTASGHLVNVE